MYQKHNFNQLNNALKLACQSIELPEKSGLYQDIINITNYLENPNFQIAVFAPFNYGKSTLLNAMLGNRTLPIDLIPTTGAAITVKYGTTLRTRILLVDGTEIYRDGTKILDKFAILDGNRQMRKDVKSVEVFCPHPFLERNVELIDLPGTNDREAQDKLVQDKLLSADLVIQLLDARKLMTLGERENLRDWLLEREIKSVIFVVNFLNLLEPEEQKQVYHRLLFVSESFRANLPPGFSNLYRVDALPALRGRLKGDIELINSSGLNSFETSLQHIVGILQQNHGDVRLPRLAVIANKMQLLLTTKEAEISQDIKNYDDKQKTKLEIKQKAQNLINKGLKDSVCELRTWLKLSNLLTKYQSDLAVALAENNFSSWQSGDFKKDLTKLQLSIMKWLYQGYEFFQAERPEDLKIPFPDAPQLNLPPKPNITNNNELLETGSIAVGTGVGWLLGGPVGAAVVGSISYLLNKNVQNNGDKSQNTHHQEVARICIAAAEKYLSDFSIQGLSILVEYEYQAKYVINFQPEQELVEIQKKREDLYKVQNALYQLSQELNKFNIQPPSQPETEINKTTNNQSKNYPKPSPETNTKEEIPNQKVTTQKVNTNKINTAELEAKFRSLEIEEEIAQIKTNINSGNKDNSGNKKQVSQNSNYENTPKTQTEKDNINNAYQILGLQPNASFLEVKETYKKLVRKWHPDLFINQPLMYKQSQEKMRLLNAAYNILEAYYQ